MLLLRRDSNASNGMHHEELYDHIKFRIPWPSPSLLFRFQETSAPELVKVNINANGTMFAVLDFLMIIAKLL